MVDNLRNAILNFQIYEWVILLIFSLLYLLMIARLVFFRGRLLFKKNFSSELPEPLSLIMTLRNEESTLNKNLPPVLSMQNAGYELVAVDDFSSDNSLTILGALKEKYDRLRFSALNQETWYSVKMAQNIAIKAAQYDWVMVIPPSVTGFHPDWLSVISANLDKGTEILVNYSNVKHKFSFFNKLYRMEFFFQQMRSFGFILNGFPYIISEENIAFKKEKYFLTGGYREKVNELFANLELLINSFIRKGNTRIVFSDKTAILKDEEITKRNYFDLLNKEIRIRKYFPSSLKFILSLDDLSGCFFIPLTALVYTITPEIWQVVTILLVLPAIVYMLIIKKAMTHLNENKLFLSSLIYALLLPCFKLIYRFYYTQYSRRKGWKSRK